jgi:glycosyltransferase involved in cell wall biosynthesis
MKIGLFSDSYLPSLDGISYSIETFRVELERRGHEVLVFAPAPGMRHKERSANIIRFPAVKGLFYDDYLTSVFFPPQALQRIKKQKLDVIHFHTPSQVGLLGAYYALRNQVPLVSTYHTDLYEYVTHYPQVLPGTIALALMAPLITRGGLRDFRAAISSIRPERNVDAWNKKIVVRGITTLHNNCDYVIAPSHKIEKQLRSWNTTASIRILPTGVDKITTNSRAITLFKSKHVILRDDKVILFVGRLGSEKNLELLLSAFALILKEMPSAKLVIVGRHEYQDTLMRQAQELGVAERTVFTGFIEHHRLGAAYESADVFAFPSRTDTQGLVLHEAANAGLPIVMIDKEITEVVRDGINGYIARNTARDLSKKLLLVLQDDAKRAVMGAASIKMARRFSATHQAIQLEKLYQHAIEGHAKAAELPPPASKNKS